MTTQTDLSAEEPAERAATGPQTMPIAQAGAEAAEPVPEIAAAAELALESGSVGEAKSVTHRDLSAQEDPTKRAIAKPKLKFKFSFKIKAPGGAGLETDAGFEVPSGSPVETAVAKFIEHVGLIVVLVVLVAVLAVVGVDTWLIAVTAGGLLVLAALITFAKKRSSRD